MAAKLKVRNLILGEGVPKICVPISGATTEALLEELSAIRQTEADLVEWRADSFLDIKCLEKVESAAKACRDACGDLPLLFTYRTQKEGGAGGDFTHSEYFALNSQLLRSGAIDMIDIEFYTGEEVCKETIRIARTLRIPVILSNHDFGGTPPLGDMLSCFENMASLGADIVKLAVMPQEAKDVLALLDATLQGKQALDDHCLVIGISMGEWGKVSRVSGRVFGSCMTFATVADASAPGQIPISEIYYILKTL